MFAAGDQQVGAAAIDRLARRGCGFHAAMRSARFIAAEGREYARHRKERLPSAERFQSEAIRSRRPLPIDPAETACNGRPIPGLTP